MKAKQNQTPTEYEEAVTFADWLRVKQLLFTHIPAGTYSHIGTAMKNKRMGLNPGAPDYLIVLPPPRGLLFVELKRLKGGKVAHEQQVWQDILNDIPGVESRICYGAGEAIAFVEEFI